MRGAQWTSATSFELADSAFRYEDWEFPYALVLGLAAATRYARAVGVEVAQQRAWSLAADLRTRLSSIPGVRVLDRGHVKSAIVTADVAGWFAPDLVDVLRERRINSAASLRWYGLLDFTPRGVTSAIRLSPHYYNDNEEIELVVQAIAELVIRAR